MFKSIQTQYDTKRFVLLLSIVLQATTQVTEIGLYGNPKASGTYPIELSSLIASPTNYNNHMLKFAIY